MTEENARQIKILLERNHLAEISPRIIDILKMCDYYKYILDENDNVISCARIVEVQWYQWELGHVCVREDMEGKGYSLKVVNEALQFAKENGALIIQCTIRENNRKSWILCERIGFKRVNSFLNPVSKNQLFVYQLNLIP